jgi:hypothetical protein
MEKQRKRAKDWHIQGYVTSGYKEVELFAVELSLNLFTPGHWNGCSGICPRSTTLDTIIRSEALTYAGQ